VAVPLVCGALRAQDTTAAAADTGGGAAVAAPPPAQLPATHTVTAGETLWSIAQTYFNDPLLWPEVYRLNTALIEDPHWIYPGEVLTLSGPLAAAPAETTAAVPAETTAAVVAPAETTQVAAADTMAATPGPPPADTALADTTQLVIEEPPPPPVGESYQTIFDRPRSRTQEVRDVLRAYTHQPYRPVRRGEFYAAGFLTEGEHLPWGRVVGTAAKPSIPRLTGRESAMVFQEIVIEPPPRASYHVGDSLLIVRVDREEGDWGGVVVPRGVARVREVARRQLLAEVVMQFGRIRDGELTLPLEPFKDPGEVRPTPIARGLAARVIDERDLHTIAITQQVVFLDRGRADGVVPGDVFQLYTGEAGAPSEDERAIVEVVHTREHSCSALILQLENPQIVPGLPARLIRKMPS
jgi:LysM domain